jgi:glycosyltransferase involved in cell wall biosynthesis
MLVAPPAPVPPPPPRPFHFLYIVDDSLERPYLRAQVPALLKRLTTPTRRFDVLSFETRVPPANHSLRRDLAAAGIGWIPLVLPVSQGFFKNSYIVAEGTRKALALHAVRDYTALHCRGHLTAAIGWMLHFFKQVPFLFELRGLPADENAALGRWNYGGVRYTFAKSWERRFLQQAAYLAAPSDAFCAYLTGQPVLRQKLKRGDVLEGSPVAVPNFVDLQRYARSEEVRARVRERRGWSGRLTFGYAEKGQRVKDTLPLALRYFKACQSVDPDAEIVLYLSGSTHAAWQMVSEFGVSPDDAIIIEGQPGLLPDYLSAVDVAFAFSTPRGPVQALTSPVRLGEYLASGLPVVLNPPGGDGPALVQQNRAGVVVDPSNPAAVAQSAHDLINQTLLDPELNARCRRVAEENFDVNVIVDKWNRAYNRLDRSIISSR